jgi:hypothetical protein
LALCAGPALATVPPVPENDGTGYLDLSTRIKTVPHWVPGSGQWAKPTFDRVNPALVSKLKGLESQSATPIPIPGPRSAAGIGVFQLGQKFATPLPLPSPKLTVYSGGLQTKHSVKSTRSFKYHRSAK